jgi:hypothetical protein
MRLLTYITKRMKKGSLDMHLIGRLIVIVALTCMFCSGALANENDWIHIDSDEIDLGNGDVQVIINYYYDKKSLHYPHDSTFLIFDRKDKNIVRVRTKTEYVTPLNYEDSIVSYCINLIEIDCAKRTYMHLDSKYYGEGNKIVKEKKTHKTASISPEMYFETLRQHICR